MSARTVQIKVCGLTRPEDCQAVNAASVDFAGFVFAPSRRQVTPAQAAVLIPLLSPGIQPVGVFVDESDCEIGEAVAAAGLAVVQLHGAAQPERLARLRQMLPGVAIWQRLGVAIDQSAADAFLTVTQAVASFQASDILPDVWLLDSCRSGQSGGTGMAFDWQLFRDLGASRPLALAGGLNPENVAEGLRIIEPAIVDTSSGVESGGLKDPDRISAFCAAVRRCNPLTSKGDDSDEPV